jgi:hypothetical protein
MKPSQARNATRLAFPSSPAGESIMNEVIDQPASNDEAIPQIAAAAAAFIDAAEREARIAVAAFHFAEARGFEPGRELDDGL